MELVDEDRARVEESLPGDEVVDRVRQESEDGGAHTAVAGEVLPAGPQQARGKAGLGRRKDQAGCVETLVFLLHGVSGSTEIVRDRAQIERLRRGVGHPHGLEERSGN